MLEDENPYWSEEADEHLNGTPPRELLPKKRQK